VWATFSIDEATRQLDDSIRQRLDEHPLSSDKDRVRCPVGILWVRGDRAEPGKALAEQTIASFGYWNEDSGRFFDVVLPGWGKDGDQIVFDPRAFLAFREQVEEISQWTYSGETELLIVQFDYDVGPPKEGAFAFDQAIQLPVETMIRNGSVAHLDGLMHELIGAAKLSSLTDDDRTLWDVAGPVARDRGREGVWKLVRRRLLGDADEIYNNLRPFAVCDLRRR
jgi:hypothetical protein